MKVPISLILLVAIAVFSIESSEGQNIFRRTLDRARDFGRRTYNYARDFGRGSRDMWNAYRDMRRANTIGADKYFHARGNYDAARHGTGGRHAATLISNIREGYQGSLSGRGAQDSAADQAANRWGRGGRDPNRYRPKGLGPQY